MIFENLTDGPPKEDSEDLTNEEIAQAVETTCPRTLVSSLQTALAALSDPPVVTGHELRRRGEHLFWRTRVAPDRVLIFRVDWLGA